MQFFKSSILFFMLVSVSMSQDMDMESVIESKSYGTCETKDLFFSAMKFYKISLNETYEGLPVQLRMLFFFNRDKTLVTRLTTQALLGCQTTSTGEEACAYKPLNDQWIKGQYELSQNDQVAIEKIGTVTFLNPENQNRGFRLKFSADFPMIKLQNAEQSGGMVKVNFNQHGINTAKLCEDM